MINRGGRRKELSQLSSSGCEPLLKDAGFRSRRSSKTIVSLNKKHPLSYASQYSIEVINEWLYLDIRGNASHSYVAPLLGVPDLPFPLQTIRAIR
jgi:hypothetical protein